MDKITLFCFPYAGGSSIVYNKWKRYTNSYIDIVPVELAGRGKRLDEHLYDKMEDAVDDLYEIIKERVNGSYGLFGHSMGSIIAYEIAHRINNSNLPNPQYLFISGKKPPHIERYKKIVHTLSDHEFKKELIDIGGTPREIFENEELLDLFLPILRKDFKVIENYKYTKRPPLDIETIVFYGLQENIQYSEAAQWNSYANKGCRIFEVEGNHFFINHSAKDVVNIINNIVAKDYRRIRSQV